MGFYRAPLVNPPIKLRNSSGGALAAGDLVYLEYDATYGWECLTTTTANDPRTYAAVLVGGANGADVYVVRRGRVSVAYTGTAPAIGDFLVSSTSAGDSQISGTSGSSTMRPDVFGVALAVGSGGLVDCLLLPGLDFVPRTSSNAVLNHNVAVSDSDFVALINAGGSGGLTATNVPYDTVSSGAAINLDVVSGNIGKLVLHNTTRGTSALVSTATTASSFITLVSPGQTGWADNDSITLRSQTNTATVAGRFFDVDVSQSTEIPVAACALVGSAVMTDSGGASNVRFHPYEADATAKRMGATSPSAGVGATIPIVGLPLIGRKFCAEWDASGAGTLTRNFRLLGWIEKTP